MRQSRFTLPPLVIPTTVGFLRILGTTAREVADSPAVSLQLFHRRILDHAARHRRVVKIPRIKIDILEVIERALVAIVSRGGLDLPNDPVEHFVGRKKLWIAVAVEMFDHLAQQRPYLPRGRPPSRR